ncbi:Hypothetical predicted protein [Cloeon dipterum]|uniref:Reverse transcriptase domain-containing protein n=1 Tax=Cloeon dipterum TaxID=197152 RepID=A0A8S1DER9_9INSE|nr:Hypothetical predicted protein [Cloeon dipterum]
MHTLLRLRALMYWFDLLDVFNNVSAVISRRRRRRSGCWRWIYQGSVLGPLLFNVFVSDLPDALNKCTLVQYADDATIYKKISCQEDADEFQEELNNVDIWCANNGMELNSRKCKVMDISRARLPLHFEYTLGDAPLEYVDSQRLLGVHIARDLRWRVHTDIVRAKAAQRLSFAARNLRGCTPRVKRIAYLTMVKPVMTFGLPAWHPTTQENINKLSRVQNRAMHFAFGKILPEPRLQNVMPFNMHLRHTDLVFFQRCQSGQTDFDARARIIQGRALRGDNTAHPRLQPPPARTAFGRSAFSYRVCKPWNDLPPSLKDCDASKFPSLCEQFLWCNF